jgi:hypothetical protein
MIMVETPDANKPLYAVWRCPGCFKTTHPLPDSICNGVSIKTFHSMLLCFVSCINPRTSRHLVNDSAGCVETTYSHIFRKAGSYYFRKKMQPFLVLPGVVEMDETYLGTTKFNCTKKMNTMVRWIFGLFCRSTKMSLLYYLKEKN